MRYSLLFFLLLWTTVVSAQVKWNLVSGVGHISYVSAKARTGGAPIGSKVNYPGGGSVATLGWEAEYSFGEERRKLVRFQLGYYRASGLNLRDNFFTTVAGRKDKVDVNLQTRVGSVSGSFFQMSGGSRIHSSGFWKKVYFHGGIRVDVQNAGNIQYALVESTSDVLVLPAGQNFYRIDAGELSRISVPEGPAVHGVEEYDGGFRKLLLLFTSSINIELFEGVEGAFSLSSAVTDVVRKDYFRAGDERHRNRYTFEFTLRGRIF